MDDLVICNEFRKNVQLDVFRRILRDSIGPSQRKQLINACHSRFVFFFCLNLCHGLRFILAL